MISKNKLMLVKEKEFDYEVKVKTNIDTIDFLENVIKLQQECEEVFVCITLDNQNNINAYFEIARGGISFCNITMSSIFKRVLLSNCEKFIIAHNHPSGNCAASQVDIETTRKILKTANLLGLQMIDSLIIGDNSQSIIKLINN